MEWTLGLRPSEISEAKSLHVECVVNVNESDVSGQPDKFCLLTIMRHRQLEWPIYRNMGYVIGCTHSIQVEVAIKVK